MKPVILVVEDAKDILENLTEILRLYEYSVTSVTNGLDVLDVAATVKPDLVLCDILLPGKNGIDILKDFRATEEFDNTPFIFLTSQSECSDRLWANQLGADDYIIKPFDVEFLIQKIAFHLESKMQLVSRTTKI